MSKDLTQKQAKFVKNIAEGKTGVEAALDAYDTDDYNTAGSIAVENLQKPAIRDAVNDAMVATGLDAGSLLKPIKDALEAEHRNYEYDPETKKRTLVKRTDHNTRLKASELGLKLAGVLGNNSESGVTINFNQHVSDKRAEYDI